MLRIRTALAVCTALLLLLFAGAEHYGPVQTPIEVQPAAQKHYNCKQYSLKKYINKKRNATWHWQAQFDQKRYPTRYREKTVKGCGYLKWSKNLWQGRADDRFHFWVKLRDNAEFAIVYVFKAYSGQALVVSWCESKHDTTAGVGKHQYLGLFQMGESERDIYGHGWTAYEQARDAHEYFVASGKDWSPWSCKPHSTQ